MSTLPSRTTANTPAEHVSDHNVLHDAYNTDRIWVPAIKWTSFSGTPAFAIVHSRYPAWAFDPTTEESVVTMVQIPDHWATWNAKVYVTQDSSGGDVVFDLRSIDTQVGIDVTLSSYATLDGAKTIVLGTGPSLLIEGTLVSAGTNPLGVITALQLVRVAGAAGDTLPVDARVYGVLLEKVS